MLQLGDIVRHRTHPSKFGFVTKVYDFPTKILIDVEWLDEVWLQSQAIETYNVFKVS